MYYRVRCFEVGRAEATVQRPILGRVQHRAMHGPEASG